MHERTLKSATKCAVRVGRSMFTFAYATTTRCAVVLLAVFLPPTGSQDGYK